MGEERVNEKSNEITAIPELLDKINIKGHIITTDAMGCQTEEARILADGGYCVAVAKEGLGEVEIYCYDTQYDHQGRFRDDGNPIFHQQLAVWCERSSPRHTNPEKHLETILGM